MKHAQALLSALLTVAAASSLHACAGGVPDDGDCGGMTTAEATGGSSGDGTTDGTTTSDESTSGGDDEWLAPTTGKAAEVCGNLTWIHANPPQVPGAGGPEWFRTFAADLRSCEEAHEVSLLIVPDNDFNAVLDLGMHKPSCVVTGGPSAKVDEPFAAPIGTGKWHGVVVMLMVDGNPVDTVSLPADIMDDQQPLVVDGIGEYVARRFGVGWRLWEESKDPECW